MDGNALTRHGTTWRCASGHSFDIARQGYTHLLPVQKKRSADPGDSKMMVSARQRFLNAAHYRPIADTVCRAVLAELTTDITANYLDAGCGEGYYLRQLRTATGGEEHSLALMGLDISKWAILSAAKQATTMSGLTTATTAPWANWVVGSNANLPVLSNTLDGLLCIFGFPVYNEFARVLKPGGILYQMDAGPDHLRELRDIIYPRVRPARTLEPQQPAEFTHRSSESIRYRHTLTDAAAIADLFAMTPHLYRTSAEGRAKASALTALEITVDAILSRFERH
jgi:23S rRNA (guanine745-N1)-methyltransferase